MTNWVMVPVPEEFSARVLERVLFHGIAASGPQWTKDLLEEHLGALDADARDLAIAVARAVKAGQPLTDAELAAELGMSVRELLGLAQEVNDVTVDPFPGAIVTIQSPRSEADVRRRGLHMNPLLAAALCQVAEDGDV